jgi:hypothetical protein
MKGIGSSLLFRIGVSGDDIHNGGVLGALQFLGGGRITMCAEPLFKAGLAKLDLETKIAAYNCGLSISGLLVVSILTILGIFWIVANFRLTKILVFPLAMSLIILASTLQQSFSVHLLGHSYPFAALFAVGTIGLLLMTLQRLRHKSLGTLVLTPLTFAIVLLSIRVTMLTSIANG